MANKEGVDEFGDRDLAGFDEVDESIYEVGDDQTVAGSELQDRLRNVMGR